MPSFELPDRRNLKRDVRFAGAGDSNRFKDQEQVGPLPGDGNMFAAPLASPREPGQPVAFELTLPHRGRLLWWLALSAVVCGLVMAIVATWAGYLGAALESALYLASPLALIAGVLGGTVLILAPRDLRAMRAGSMDASGRIATIWSAILASAAAAAALAELSTLVWFSLVALLITA